MYAHCMGDASVCDPLTLCVQFIDGDSVPFDGFCTKAGCVNPATDCDPSPGGTAVPMCMDVEVNGTPDKACALDCSDGKTCPTGMVCHSVGTGICG